MFRKPSFQRATLRVLDTGMFAGTTSFDRALSAWDTDAVTKHVWHAWSGFAPLRHRHVGYERYGTKFKASQAASGLYIPSQHQLIENAAPAKMLVVFVTLPMFHAGKTWLNVLL